MAATQSAMLSCTSTRIGDERSETRASDIHAPIALGEHQHRMPTEMEHGSESGLSRRQLIARGAIAGGLVWAAPVIRTTAAYATTANGTERPCQDFFMVVIGPSGQVRPAPGNVHATEVPPAIRQWFDDNPAVPVAFPDVRPQLTQAGDQVWAVLLPEVTGPNAAGRQCRMVIGWARGRGHHFAEGFVDPNPPLSAENGRRLLFPCPDKSIHGDSVVGSTTADTSVAANASSSSSVGSDGSSGPSIGSDGSVSPTTSDGRPSGPSTGHGTCIEAVYLIFCCPR